MMDVAGIGRIREGLEVLMHPAERLYPWQRLVKD